MGEKIRKITKVTKSVYRITKDKKDIIKAKIQQSKNKKQYVTLTERNTVSYK